MPRRKIKYDVVLNDLGRQELCGLGPPLMRDGRYFNCLEVSSDMHFLRLVIDFEYAPGRKTNVELRIPHHYVKYVISAQAEARIGFEPSSHIRKTQK